MSERGRLYNHSYQLKFQTLVNFNFSQLSAFSWFFLIYHLKRSKSHVPDNQNLKETVSHTFSKQVSVKHGHITSRIRRHVYDHSERQTKKRNDSSSQCKLSDFCVVHEYVEAKQKEVGRGGGGCWLLEGIQNGA